MMNWTVLHRAGESAVDAVTGSFSPPLNATPIEIRKNGLYCIGVGVLSFLVGGGVLFAFPQAPAIAMLPLLMGYAFMIVGSYRAVFGKSPQAEHPGEASPTRILFAILAIVLSAAALLGLVWIVFTVFGIK